MLDCAGGHTGAANAADRGSLVAVATEAAAAAHCVWTGCVELCQVLGIWAVGGDQPVLRRVLPHPPGCPPACQVLGDPHTVSILKKLNYLWLYLYVNKNITIRTLMQ